MGKHYLIFERDVHSVVQLVQADTITDALWHYVSEQNADAVLLDDGSVTAGDAHYPHPLAYIEVHYKTEGEWQIRELPDWAWQNDFAEVFCGESADGPPSVITDCRKHFAQEFPKRRAKAFLWYLTTGTLVTFYQRQGAGIKVLKRYLWNWDGRHLTVEEWLGSYRQIVDALLLLPPRWHSPRRRQSSSLDPRPKELPPEPPARGSLIVVLSPDVAARFSSSETVNRALRTLIDGESK